MIILSYLNLKRNYIGTDKNQKNESDVFKNYNDQKQFQINTFLHIRKCITYPNGQKISLFEGNRT